MIKRTITLTKGDQFFRDGLPIYVNRVNESYELSQHVHDFWEISYVREGGGTHYIEDEAVHVARGDLFFIPVGTSHVFRPSSARQSHPLVVDNCIFRLDALERTEPRLPFHALIRQIAESHRLDDRPYLQFKESRTEFSELFSTLYSEYRNQLPEFQMMLYTTLYQLLVALVRSGAGSSPSTDPSFSRLEPLLHYLDEHYDEPPTVAEAASRCELSERQFQRLFKRCTKVTYVEYIQNIRIEQSCLLLRTGMMNVSEIAGRVGYQDMKFFNQLFKKKTGLTPRQYRIREFRSPAADSPEVE